MPSWRAGISPPPFSWLRENMHEFARLPVKELIKQASGQPLAPTRCCATGRGGIGGGPERRRAAPAGDARFATHKRPGAAPWTGTGKAIADYRMIEPGDRDGGAPLRRKDLYTPLDLLFAQQQPCGLRPLAVNLDQKHPGYPAQVLPEYLRSRGVPSHHRQDTYRVVKRRPEGRTMCSLCSRMRRGRYRYASEHGISKIAPGHHRDESSRRCSEPVSRRAARAMAPKFRRRWPA
jgi:hypothetical protein